MMAFPNPNPEAESDLHFVISEDGTRSMSKYTAACPSQDILVLGIGNPLMGDDGVGIHVIELLAGTELPPNVTVKAAGLPGWGLPSWFDSKTNVILVDAMQMGEPPGTWKRFLPEEIRVEMESGTLSLHQTDLACGLALSQALDLLPENLLIYGIEPDGLEPGAPLSPAVTASLPKLIANIMLDVEKIIV